ncbi:MAG: nucleotidyltransferase family protein, partial [Dehalococcoidia bacterium]
MRWLIARIAAPACSGEGGFNIYALTLVGGRGERLKPITDTMPKAMVPLNDRPLLQYQVEWMREQGVTDVVFLCGYLAEKIQEHFGDGSDFGVTAHYSLEESPLGRGGAIRKGMSLVPASERLVIVTNGDNITRQPLAPMLELHRRTGAVGTLLLVRYPSQFGIVQLGGDDLIEAFVEKGDLPIWINAGVYVFSREIEGLLPEVGDHETTTFPALAEERRLAALPSDALWLTVDGPKELREVAERLRDEGLAPDA